MYSTKRDRNQKPEKGLKDRNQKPEFQTGKRNQKPEKNTNLKASPLCFLQPLLNQLSKRKTGLIKNGQIHMVDLKIVVTYTYVICNNDLQATWNRTFQSKTCLQALVFKIFSFFFLFSSLIFSLFYSVSLSHFLSLSRTFSLFLSSTFGSFCFS